MKIFALAILIAFCLSACGNDINLRPTIVKSYSLGVEKVAHVGEPIISVKGLQGFGGRLIKAFTSETGFTVSAVDGRKIDYPVGTPADVVAMAMYDGDSYYVIELAPALPGSMRLLINPDGEYNSTALSSDGAMVEPCDNQGAACITPETVEFKATTFDTTTAASGNFEIIYSGATKDIINLLYREYTPDNMARTAFAQNLTYDRSSPFIQFRNLQIKVLDANNESIRYVVVADGSSQVGSK
ncbi:MAG: hypothetical protein L0H70_01700 [Xanthomonadales bacterium]|nr:hypothetical protein [Xanthomonadales bacterium]